MLRLAGVVLSVMRVVLGRVVPLVVLSLTTQVVLPFFVVVIVDAFALRARHIKSERKN